MSYILKQQQEDFVVTEITNLNFLGKGKFVYFSVKKRNRNTVDVVREIAKQLRIKEKEVGFAGSKDKNAVTEQVCSAKFSNKSKLDKLNVDNVTIKFLGYGNKPISLGDLAGNKFQIVVRNLDKETKSPVKLKPTKFVANYFDEQRFSIHNVDIGRHLVRKEFREAARLIDDSRCQKHLEQKEKKHDYIGAMLKIPIRLLRMYVHAYQSYIWNETLATYLRTELEDDAGQIREVTYSLGKFVFVDQRQDFQIPLIGFATAEQELDPKIEQILDKIMQKEELDYNDFIIKQIPAISLEGDSRNAFVDVSNLEMGELESDELNIGKKKVKLSFSLGKGSYATMVVRKIVVL